MLPHNMCMDVWNVPYKLNMNGCDTMKHIKIFTWDNKQHMVTYDDPTQPDGTTIEIIPQIKKRKKSGGKKSCYGNRQHIVCIPN